VRVLQSTHAALPTTMAATFRQLLNSSELSFVMEAHSGLSAKIVEEAGFPAIWASGLSVSAALGVRDRNEASWTQVVEVLEFMSDAVSIPIFVDGDTGYGDFNNFRRLTGKLCQRGIAAVCIEDKVFPKTNSFLDGDQTLAGIDEFCGKIKAGKDAQTDDDFSIVARVEALIAGLGMAEALRRAEAYRLAGADGILIHSRKSTADEILQFAKEWANRAPLVIVPTKYYITPTDRFREAAISVAIWANHNLRASISAMRETSQQIMSDQSLIGVEGRVADLNDVFELSGNTELVEAEERYLPAGRTGMTAILLAASRGSKLGELTVDRPKCMLEVGGEPLLKRLAGQLKHAGVRDISVVAGYKQEAINLPDIKKSINADYANTGEVASLACALDALQGECVLSYGDILFRRYILDLLLETDGDIVVVVEAIGADRSKRAAANTSDLAKCNIPFSDDYLEDQPIELEQISADLDDETSDGVWIGLVKLSERGSALLRDEIEAMREDGSFSTASLPDAVNRLIAKGHKPRVVYIAGHWLDVNDVVDLAKARDFR
jgi:phosphoenolpyruvate phosphomutase